jgi:tyrosine-protein kinase Etk/Wzc
MNTNELLPLDLSFLRNSAALKRIGAATVACAAIAGLYGLLAPKWYASAVSVVPTKQQKASSLSSVLAGDIPIGGLDATGSADATRIAAVLESTSVTDAVIAKFDLVARYGEKYQENAREELWRHCAVKTISKASLVRLTCEDKDPAFVQRMLGYFAEYGNEVFRRIGVSSASEEVKFLAQRVADLRQQAGDAAARLREFQEENQIIDLDTQAKAVVSSLATLNSERISKQLELGYAREFSSNDEATTQQLESQLGVLENKFRDLGGGSTRAASPRQAPKSRGPDVAGGMFPAALDVPKLRSELEILLRDRKVSEAVLVIAMERLESARANEARNVSTFVLLDPPAQPTRHYRPRTGKLTMIAALLALVSAVAFEWWRSMAGRGPLAPARLLQPSGTDGVAEIDA